MNDIDDQDEIEGGYPESQPQDTPNQPAAPAPMHPDVISHLQSLPEYSAPQPANPVLAAFQKSQDDMAAAQQLAAQNRYDTGMHHALDTLGHAFGTTKVDEDAWKSQDQNANQPVTDVTASQKAGADAIKTQADLQSAVHSSNMLDPTSKESRLAQKLIKTIYGDKYSDEDLANLPAADAQELAYRPLELDQKIKELTVRHEEANALRSDRMDSKASLDQAKAYTSMRKDLESFRGNQSVQQAAVAVQNGEKAMALTNATPTSQNLTLLADEMGKIATNGVPGEHGAQALMPNNLNTKIAEMRAWITSNPNASAPDVKQYLDNNRDYIQQVMDISKKSLNSYRTNIAKGYRGRVSPSDYQEVTSDYGLSGDRDPSNQITSIQAAPSAQAAPASLIARQTKDGKTALFDANTKKFVRYQ